jgi:hypothetical protein
MESGDRPAGIFDSAQLLDELSVAAKLGPLWRPGWTSGRYV